MSGRWAGAVRDLLQTALRLVPWPAETGLRRVGDPGPASPVIVTGNYDLTVRRVLRAVAGLDVWVVVAPASGINVWCAAAGGHFGSHQVVTALKTSGVESRVEHRRAILPQLAATGVEAGEVRRRCGWRVRFGPVYARDLPRYLAQGGKKAALDLMVELDRKLYDESDLRASLLAARDDDVAQLGRRTGGLRQKSRRSGASAISWSRPRNQRSHRLSSSSRRGCRATSSTYSSCSANRWGRSIFESKQTT